MNNPADRGGPTKYGITQRTLAEYNDAPVTFSDVQALTEDEARDIYIARYYKLPGFDAIEDGELLALVVDVAVLHGAPRATRMLQRALGVLPDGVMGPQTRAALAEKPARTVRAKMCAERIRAVTTIATSDPTQLQFLRGWINRACEFVETLG